MNFFEISDKVNQNKQLNLQEKVLLNQALSYQLNNREFFATNEYLADYWNTSVSTIKRALAALERLQLIERRKERKKHQSGAMAWYNKRYITVNVNELMDFLSEEKQSLIINDSPEGDTIAEQVELVEIPLPTLSTEDGCFFGGNYPDEENEFSRFFGKQVEPSELQRMLTYARSLSHTPKKGMAEWLLKNHQDWDEAQIRGVYDALLETNAA